ncbi:helix-turn-helix transcriptional regulator [Actinoplanes bogorensis]|uniref:Helix-turn-helix transcriptional regulator n=1 Tax=Paractinoplanes bogorensis TaxID=1610840 RepID=A0ABS5YX93_9ACTN|nr:helix-turn-helix transcriptional regulator [Actinoplanes bogorensis]MBU2668051.1 helix-turn-helix transcriptional regulator [Actinoplanes bogorensis]
MDSKRRLGEFLQARRSQIRPEDVGLAGHLGRRRVPGLRREELAQLAGVSSSYYARLEQGFSLNASPQVLDAIGRALRLDEAELRHLHELAGGGRARTAPRRSPPERMTVALARMLEAMGETPAVVLGRFSDVLAWNPAGHALFAGHLDVTGPERPRERPNMARLVFLDPHTRELYADWPVKAKAVVGSLRRAAGQHPSDAALSALIGELTVSSAEFAEMWATYRVKGRGSLAYAMRHPLVGALTVTQHALQTEDGPSVVIATTEPGSPSRAAMALLIHSLTGTATLARA